VMLCGWEVEAGVAHSSCALMAGETV